MIQDALISSDTRYGNSQVTLSVDPLGTMPTSVLNMSHPSSIGASDGLIIHGHGSSGLTYRADFYWLIRITLASDSTIDEETIEAEEPNSYIDVNNIEAGDISIRVSVTTVLGTSTFIVFNKKKKKKKKKKHK